MIDLIFVTSPNVYKASIALEEMGLPYTIHPVDISQGGHLKPENIAYAPNAKLPGTLVERNDMTPMSTFRSSRPK